MRYIKIVVLIGAMAGAGWLGHKVTQAHYLAESAKITEKAAKEYNESVTQFKQSIAKKDNILREVRKTNIELAKRLKLSETKYEEAIKDAIEGSVVAGYSVGFGRVWNDSICRANGMPGCPGDSGGLASDRRASNITSEALIRNHGELMRKLATCYRNLENIKSLQDKYRQSLQEK